MQNNKLLLMLGLCRKAGKLVQGFEAVGDSVKGAKTKLVLVSDEISQNSLKAISEIAEKHNTPIQIMHVQMAEIEKLTKKRAGIVGIADQNFARAINDIIMAERQGGAAY